MNSEYTASLAENEVFACIFDNFRPKSCIYKKKVVPLQQILKNIRSTNG